MGWSLVHGLGCSRSFKRSGFKRACNRVVGCKAMPIDFMENREVYKTGYSSLNEHHYRPNPDGSINSNQKLTYSFEVDGS